MAVEKNNVSAIISFLDAHLLKTGKPSIDAVQANALLGKAGLLNDSLDRPGKPLREKLRKGQLPHAYQVGGKSSNWVIPISKSSNVTRMAIRKSPNAPSAKNSTAQNSTPIFKTTKSSELSVILKQLAENTFDPHYEEYNKVHDCPGNYIMCLKANSELPTLSIQPVLTKFNGLKVIYTGIASKSLRKRDYKQHFQGNNAGRSTLRKSLGVLFGYPLIPRDKDPLTGKTKFPDADEAKLTEWMCKNLVMYFLPTSSYVDTELELIRHFDPPLNLKDCSFGENTSFREMLSQLRRNR
jgi:hypothetical protein